MACPALLVLVGLHIFGRSRPWEHEWLWAIYQYHFSTVLLGPAAAGLAAWEGFRAQQAEDLLESSGRAGRAVALAWAAVFAWVLVAYTAGLLTVLALVKLSGTPGLPRSPELLTLLPALALLAGETSTSFAVAWRVRSPLVAPAAAIAWFLVTLLLYVGGPEAAIRVGGATTSLVGLRPRPDVQAAQVLFYVSLAVLSLLSMRRRVYAERFRLRALRLAGLAVPALPAILLASLGPNVLERVPTRLACFGRHPLLCAAPGYVNRLPEVRAVLRPYLAALEAIGVDTPTRFDQSAPPGSAAAPLPIEIFLRTSDHEVARSTVLQWYERSGCNVSGNVRLVQDYVGLDYWLEAQATGEHPDDPTLPRALAKGTEDQQAIWVRRALGDLQACAA